MTRHPWSMVNIRFVNRRLFVIVDGYCHVIVILIAVSHYERAEWRVPHFLALHVSFCLCRFEPKQQRRLAVHIQTIIQHYGLVCIELVWLCHKYLMRYWDFLYCIEGTCKHTLLGTLKSAGLHTSSFKFLKFWKVGPTVKNGIFWILCLYTFPCTSPVSCICFSPMFVVKAYLSCLGYCWLFGGEWVGLYRGCKTLSHSSRK